MTLDIGPVHAKNIADAHELPYLTDPTIHAQLPNYEHTEMDLYNNEVGRQIGIIAQLLSPLSSKEMAVTLAYLYATSDAVYYRINDDGSVRSIEEARRN